MGTLAADQRQRGEYECATARGEDEALGSVAESAVEAPQRTQYQRRRDGGDDK